MLMTVDDNTRLIQENAELKREKVDLEAKLTQLSIAATGMELLRQQNHELQTLGKHNSTLQKQNEELRKYNSDFKQQVEALRKHNSDLYEQNENLRRENAELRQENATLFDQIKLLEARITLQDATIAGLDKKLVEQDATIAGLDKRLVEQDADIGELKKTLMEQDATIAGLDKKLVEQDDTIAGLNKKLVEQHATIAEQNKKLVEQDAAIGELKKTLMEQEARHLRAHHIRLIGQLALSVMNLVRRYIFHDKWDDEDARRNLQQNVRKWHNIQGYLKTEQQQQRYQELSARFDQSRWATPLYILSQIRMGSAHPSTFHPDDVDAATPDQIKAVATDILAEPEWGRLHGKLHVKGSCPSAEEMVERTHELVDFASDLANELECDILD